MWVRTRAGFLDGGPGRVTATNKGQNEYQMTIPDVATDFIMLIDGPLGTCTALVLGGDLAQPSPLRYNIVFPCVIGAAAGPTMVISRQRVALQVVVRCIRSQADVPVCGHRRRRRCGRVAAFPRRERE